MPIRLRTRFWVEALLGSAGLVIAVMTVLWHDWIELIFGVDPDNGSGAAEWLVVGLLLSAAVSFAIAARFEWHHAHVQ